MSIDYFFYDLSGKYVFSREGGRVHRAQVFCKVMGLPEIPFITGSYNEAYWRIPGGTNSVGLPLGEEKMHSEIKTCYSTVKQYAHWKHWGMEKLNSINLVDVQGRFLQRYAHCYEADEALSEIKEDILLFLDAFTSASYRRMSF